jgi:excisionase family DNA binding protein
MKNTDLTTREASAVLGVSIRQILTLLYEGKLPGHKVGMVWQIPASAVEQRLEARKTRNG